MFLSPSYWFDLSPEPLYGIILQFFFFFFTAIVLAGIILRVLGKNRARDRYARQFFLGLAPLFFTMGVIGWFILFFRYEGIYLLGARFWYVLWIIVFGLWLGFVLRYHLKIVPQKRQHADMRREQRKYLPGPKRH